MVRGHGKRLLAPGGIPDVVGESPQPPPLPSLSFLTRKVGTTITPLFNHEVSQPFSQNNRS